jgi:hypothetical protein
MQYFLSAHGLIFSAFTLGFEDAGIPFGPVEGTELLLSCMCNIPVNLFHVETLPISC